MNLTKRKFYKLGEIVGQCGGELIGDPAIRVTQVATLESAVESDITFVSQSRFLPQLGRTRAGAVIVGADAREATSLPRIVCANPYAYFARAFGQEVVSSTFAGRNASYGYLELSFRR